MVGKDRGSEIRERDIEGLKNTLKPLPRRIFRTTSRVINDSGSVILICLLMVSSLSVTGIVTIGAGQSDVFGEEINQEITLTPSPETSYKAGGSYWFNLHSSVLSSGVFETKGVSEPNITVTVISPNGATIESVPEAASAGYTDVGRGGASSIHLGGSELNAGEEYRFPFKVKLPSSDESETLRIRITASGNGEQVRKVVTYPVRPTVDTDASTPKSLAKSAQARADLVEQYRLMYNDIFNDGGLEENRQQSISQAFSIYSKEIVETAITETISTAAPPVGYAADIDKLNSIRKGEDAASQVGDLSEGLVGELEQQMALDDVQRQNDGENVSKGLYQLEQLYRQEADAWERGNYEEARRTLTKERQAICLNSESSDYECLVRGISGMPAAADNRGYSNLYEFLLSLNRFLVGEDEQIEDNRLPLTRTPEPSVTIEDESQVRQQLDRLSVGDTATVTFTVSNEPNAGPSDMGYLSISHASSLNVTEVTAVSPENASTKVIRNSPGERVNGSSGETTLEHPLVDIISGYDSDETHTYRVVLEKQGPGDAWITYRTAFRPLIGSERGYQRSPDSGTEGQQGWPVHRLEEPQQTDLQVDFSHEPNRPERGQEVRFTAAVEPSDAQIRSYRWDFENDASYEATGASTDKSFSSSGSKEVTLEVTASDGSTSEITKRIAIEPAGENQGSAEGDEGAGENEPPTVDFSYTPANPEVDEKITFTAEARDPDGSIQSYGWDFNEDSEIDERGKQVPRYYLLPGTNPVTLFVTDDDGATRQVTKEVTITDSSSDGDEQSDSANASDADNENNETSPSSAEPEPLIAPFTETFEENRSSWSIGLREEWDSRPTEGSGNWSAKYNGSVKLEVDGAPNHIGVYRRIDNLTEGQQIVVNYESSDLEGAPGGPRILLHEPDGSGHSLDFDQGGKGEADGELVGTVPDDMPNGTFLEVRLGVWPGDITVYVEDVTVRSAGAQDTNGGEETNGTTTPESERSNETNSSASEPSPTENETADTNTTTPSAGQPSDTGSSTIFEVISEDDGELNYAIVIDGTVQKTRVSEKIKAEDNDDVRRRDDGTVVISGFTGNAGYGDAYEIAGEIVSFERESGNAAIRLEQDGEDVTDRFVEDRTAGRQSESSTFEVISEESGEVNYEIRVNGTVQKTRVSEKIKAEGNDEIRRRDDGTVVIMGFTGNPGYGDAYEIAGEIISFERESDDVAIRLEQDGEDVTNQFVNR